jgi:NAD(P)-dependent dehydrogenase (short-subunit alcohol dehydrogenase family)
MNVLDSFSLKGRVALVTGGAGLYGRQILAALAEAGAKTFVASRDLKALQKVAEQECRRGLDVQAVSFDQANEESILALRDTVYEKTGRVDVLVSNSVLRPMQSWSDPAAHWEKSLQVNATGLFLITRAFGDRMAEAGRGSIINVGSIYGVVGPDFWLYEEVGWPQPPDYWFNKGGMQNFTRFAAAHYGPRGVRCNVINPGGCFNNHDERFLKRYVKRVFLDRMANDTDLKGVIVFLASDASAYVTGAVIAVDGGLTAK